MKFLIRAIFTCISLSLSVIAAHADTFTVGNTNDSGSGSLREAIDDANLVQNGCEMQTILFDIPGTGVHTIQPLSELPPFNIPIFLDGYSQSGSSMNTLRQGDDAQLRVELDGSLAGDSRGFVIAPSVPGSGLCGGSGSTIRGLAINRFAQAAIYEQGVTCQLGISCGVGGVYIQGNFIGTDVTGSVALGNLTGIEFRLHTARNVVGDDIVSDGGPVEPSQIARNLISGNALDGVYLYSEDESVPSLDHRIRNNYIGVDATGTVALPNGRHGVFADVGSAGTQIVDNLITGHPSDGVYIADGMLDSTDIVNNGIGVGIGGVALGNAGDGVHVDGPSRGVSVAGRYGYLDLHSASIANNGGAGVYVNGPASVDVRANIGGNGGLGIDLAPRGVNPHDDTQPESGPNEMLNAPVLTSLTFDSGTFAVGLDGTLNTSPNTGLYIHIFQNDACDPSGYGEGQEELDFIPVSTDANGNATFHYDTFLFEGVGLTAFTRRFSMDPDDSTLIVSEFSNCMRVGGSDVVFADGFGG